jgi:hypothetical protein
VHGSWYRLHSPPLSTSPIDVPRAEIGKSESPHPKPVHPELVEGLFFFQAVVHDSRRKGSPSTSSGKSVFGSDYQINGSML